MGNTDFELSYLQFKRALWDFPGGTVAKTTLPMQGPGFNLRELDPTWCN